MGQFDADKVGQFNADRVGQLRADWWINLGGFSTMENDTFPSTVEKVVDIVGAYHSYYHVKNSGVMMVVDRVLRCSTRTTNYAHIRASVCWKCVRYNE